MRKFPARFAMRVIAGQAHGRRLKAPRGLTTRPTSARARQSIFSRLQVRIDFSGIGILDIFAGSGSLSCEAFSRGAAHATLIDSSRTAVGVIADNLKALGVSARARIINADVFRALDGLGAEGARFNLIFIDAPFKNDISGLVLERIAARDLAAPGGWIVVGQSKRAAAPPGAPAGFERVDVAKLGDHRIAFYRRPFVAPCGS